VLPSAGAVNTGLTIAALALRVGDGIAKGIRIGNRLPADGRQHRFSRKDGLGGLSEHPETSNKS
jgi:choline dehydrogenase-like flavoprotein